MSFGINSMDPLLRALAEEAEREGLIFDAEHKKPRRKSGRGGPSIEEEMWLPPLTATGEEAFFCDLPYQLYQGERGGGKTIAAGHRFIKHGYDYDGAAVCIAAITRSAATLGGIWTKIQDTCLPAWVDGLGVQGEGPNGQFVFKMDDARNRYFWLRSMDGGWAMFFLRPMMHGEHIRSRIKGMEFTAFGFDELVEAKTEDYFIEPIQQLGRIMGIPNQFYLGCCNPADEGEDHWVYKRFFTGFDRKDEKRPKRKKDYAVWHFPMSENNFMPAEEKQRYLDRVYEACRTDPTAADRLLHGKWVKKNKEGNIFGEYFVRTVHVKGDAEKGTYIIPTGRVVDVGYDMGPVNTSITFEQRVQTRAGEAWIIFDEICLVEKYVPIPEVAPKLLYHMNYWCGRTKQPLIFNHISDAAAFTHTQSDGSYDHRILADAVYKELSEHPERYPHLHHLITWERDSDGHVAEPAVVEDVEFTMIPCPKPTGSKVARVKLLKARLQAKELLISARCKKHIEMFDGLMPDKKVNINSPERSPHLHVFDSATYPMYHYEMGGMAVVVDNDDESSAVEWVDLG